MGTEILLPRDWLIERTRVSKASVYRRNRSYGSVNNHFNGCYRSNRKPVGRSERPDLMKRVISNHVELSSVKRSSSDGGLIMSGLVTDKLTILRRGQSLDSIIGSKKSDKEGVVSETMRKQIRIVGENCEMYAGSAFYISPTPSSLPLPSFCKKKEVSVTVEDSATKDLRRLLQLEM